MAEQSKLISLGAAAQFDISCACGDTGRFRGDEGRWIYPAVLPDGRRAFLFKVLMSNACSRDCLYCAQRASRGFGRESFTPEELASTFMDLLRQDRVSGLFLSSAMAADATRTMDGMLKAVELVRFRHRFRGFIHLKVLPGARADQVEAAARLANRLSVNMEAPTEVSLRRICPAKDIHKDIFERMKWVADLVRAKEYRVKGQTTQFVVGPGGETDRELLRTSRYLYAKVGLSRTYFSAFQPVEDTPLAEAPATAPLREHRLYQADFLMRKYGFGFDEIPFAGDGSLPARRDPKTEWALRNPGRFPVEVNTAAPEELLRVPGIGPVTARRIVEARAQAKIRQVEDLRRLGARAPAAAMFLLFDGIARGEDGQQRLRFAPG